MRKLVIDIDEKLFEDFSIECIKRKKTKAEVVRQLINEWMKNE